MSLVPPDSEEFIDLTKPEVREKISADAGRIFINIMAAWKIDDKDAAKLLSGVSQNYIFSLKGGRNRPMGERNLRKISYLIGIFESLNIIYDQELADEWINIPNSNPLFNKVAPKNYLMGREGITRFKLVRDLLYARRFGHNTTVVSSRISE